MTATRIPRARVVVVMASVVVSAAILWLARGYTFYFDEWTFILGAPGWTAATLLQPHNEHPVMLTRALYAALLNTVGLRSYLPYMVALLLTHAASAVLLFELVRRRAGDVPAAAAAAILLVLGAGWENLLWAFQVAFTGSVTCGLAALLILSMPASRPRAAASALLVALGLTFSGIGLFFAAAATLRLAFDPSRRREVLWLAPVGVALAAWYIWFGRSGQPVAPGSLETNLAALPAYVAWGLASSAAGLVGLGGTIGLAVLAGAVGAIGLAWWRRPPDALALGVAAGLVAFYAVTGAARAQLGYGQAGAGRYVYVGAVLWLILLADAARHVPWRGTWRPALAALLFLACFNDAVVLFEYAVAKDVQMQREVADLQALDAMRGDPCLDPAGTPDPAVIPQVNRPSVYYRAVDLYGDPVAGIAIGDRADFEAARHRLRRAGC